MTGKNLYQIFAGICALVMSIFPSSTSAQRTVDRFEPDFDKGYCLHSAMYHIWPEQNYLPHYHSFYSKTAKTYKVKSIETRNIGRYKQNAKVEFDSAGFITSWHYIEKARGQKIPYKESWETYHYAKPNEITVTYADSFGRSPSANKIETRRFFLNKNLLPDSVQVETRKNEITVFTCGIHYSYDSLNRLKEVIVNRPYLPLNSQDKYVFVYDSVDQEYMADIFPGDTFLLNKNGHIETRKFLRIIFEPSGDLPTESIISGSGDSIYYAEIKKKKDKSTGESRLYQVQMERIYVFDHERLMSLFVYSPESDLQAFIVPEAQLHWYRDKDEPILAKKRYYSRYVYEYYK